MVNFKGKWCFLLWDDLELGLVGTNGDQKESDRAILVTEIHQDWRLYKCFKTNIMKDNDYISSLSESKTVVSQA